LFIFVVDVSVVIEMLPGEISQFELVTCVVNSDSVLHTCQIPSAFFI